MDIICGFTILGVFLTLTAWINGRTIKKYLGELIAKEEALTRKMMDEGFRRMDERTEKIAEKIAELIVTEGEKTRELIKALK